MTIPTQSTEHSNPSERATLFVFLVKVHLIRKLDRFQNQFSFITGSFRSFVLCRIEMSQFVICGPIGDSCRNFLIFNYKH